MLNAFFVRRRQAVRDLHSVVGRLAHRDWPALQPLAQRLTLQRLRHQILDIPVRRHLVHDKNVGMVQRRRSSRFLLEPDIAWFFPAARVGY